MTAKKSEEPIYQLTGEEAESDPDWCSLLCKMPNGSAATLVSGLPEMTAESTIRALLKMAYFVEQHGLPDPKTFVHVESGGIIRVAKKSKRMRKEKSA